jgi:hypothetical protein
VNANTTTTRRDWTWDSDGALEGLYVETRSVVVKNGPAAGKEKLVFDFHVGDRLVSVWETAVIRSKFRAELANRNAPDFDPNERITITPAGTKTGAHGDYRDFTVVFEHAAPKRTTAELLGGDPGDPVADPADPGPEVDLSADEPKPDDDIPF